MKYTYEFRGLIEIDSLFTNEAIGRVLMNMLNEKADFHRENYDKYLSSKRHISLEVKSKGG